MKYIVYVFLLLFTYGCKDTPSKKSVLSAGDTLRIYINKDGDKTTYRIDTARYDDQTSITLPDSNAVLEPPFGDEKLNDTTWIAFAPKVSVGHAKGRLYQQGKGGSLPSKWIKRTSSFPDLDDSVRLGLGASFGVSRMKVDSSIGNEFKRHLILGVAGDTETNNGGDSVPKGEKIFFAYGGIKLKRYYDTIKVFALYCDTSLETRAEPIKWQYLYMVKERNRLFGEEYYLDLDRKRVKESLVVMQAMFTEPRKPN